jgi:hypothetical protein
MPAVNHLDLDLESGPPGSSFSYIWLLEFALMGPNCLIGFGVGCWCITLAIRDWQGNVNRVLLLCLLDASQKQTDADKPS